MASVVMVAFGWVVLRERQGHTTLVGRLADRVSEVDAAASQGGRSLAPRREEAPA